MASQLALRRGAPALRAASRRGVEALRSYAAAAEAGVRELKTDQEYRDALAGLKASGGAAILDFSASWCAPCKMIAPVYSELAGKYPDVAFLKVDIDNEGIRQTVAENNIASVPTFVGIKGGQAVSAFSGADRAQLLRMVRELTGDVVRPS